MNPDDELTALFGLDAECRANITHIRQELRHAITLHTKIRDETLASVRRARTNGATWQHIADIAGITKQAAHLRWAHRIPTSKHPGLA